MDFFSQHLLSLLIWFPVVGGVLVLATGDDRRAAAARWLALGISVVTFILSVALWTG